MRLAGALWLFWYMHGHVTEARRWLRRALDAAPDEPSEARAEVLYGAGYLACEQNENEEALALLEASFAYAKEVGATATAAIAAAVLCPIRAETAAARPIVGRQWPWARRRSLSRARQETTSCSRSR